MANFTITFGRGALAAAALLFLGIEMAPGAQPTPPPSHGKVFGHGSGLIAVEVDFETGKVKSVRMAASTGHADLDAAALKAFQKVRYKPRTTRHLTVPVTFQLKGRIL